MTGLFLSIQAQDFIEDRYNGGSVTTLSIFLSIQAQDFIEDLIPHSGKYSAKIP